MSELLLDAAGRRRSPATLPDFRAGRSPRNKGIRYPADPPTIEEIATATVLELGPMAKPRCADIVPCVGCAGFGRLALLLGARRRRSTASATRRPDARQERSKASAHHSGALRRRIETRCRVTPKRSAIWSIVRPSA
jgi:hypothetical protein